MILDIDEQVITDSPILSELIEESSSSESIAASLINYENTSFVNLLLADSFDLTNFILNYLSNTAQNLQNNCTESSFEFKIFTILLITLLTTLIAIGIGWKIFGGAIDHFYKRQGTASYYL
jgi:hypothetical protein